MANTLECSNDKGIKECRKDAEAFCDGKIFNLKSTDSSYIISCSDSEPSSEKIEKPNVEEKTSVTETVVPLWRFAAGIGYNGGAAAESDLTVRNISNFSSATGTVEYDVNSGFNINFEGRFLRKNGWGLTMGADFDLTREIDSGTITLGSNTVTVSGASDPDEITTLVLYGNAVYMWEQFYIPFGFNVSFIDYKSTGLNVNTTPSIGAQLGIGFQANDHFAFELFSRALGFELDYLDGNLDVQFEDGIMTDFVLRVKYIF